MPVIRWRNSRHSNPNGNCVEIRVLNLLELTCAECGRRYIADADSDAAREKLCNDSGLPGGTGET